MDAQLQIIPDMKRRAVFSEDGIYRYTLERIWNDDVPPMMFICFNPSKADAERDDSTVRRCIRFARDWGYGGLLMGNLFAFCSTDPTGLPSFSPPPLGEWGEWRDGRPRNVNDEWLEKLSRRAALTVAAWGSIRPPKGWENRASQVHEMFPFLHCLALTGDGRPVHPLRQSANLRPLPMARHQHDWGSWRGAHQSLETRTCKTCGRQEWD